ncbi:MAG: ABC transporter ATP-binding protein [Oscillospiraceae bacterium]|jgi:lipopolysaccharide transport system ATP-binding protein|nr:ABC transporter ATP-binding protein [Oscillospiraceae bacterium]
MPPPQKTRREPLAFARRAWYNSSIKQRLEEVKCLDTPIAVRVDGVGKRYSIKDPTARIDTLVGAQTGRLRAAVHKARQKRKKTDFWALRGATLEIHKGESVGIIGKNGAGKSTLLKLLSRVTEPTTGRIEVHGRLAAMLEVGTGFNGELTGRENIYLNGAILGMSKAEISRKLDSIIAFSEIGQFIDTPVKRYSSGMYVRLGFAVAAHLEPDIMVVDEVLAVGDAKFQRKCLDQMAAVVESGCTVLFVSHQMHTIRALCKRVIVLNAGQVVYDGETEEGINCYLAEGGRRETDIDLSVKDRFGHISGELRLLRVELPDVTGCAYEPDAPLRFRVTFRCESDCADARLRFELSNARGPVGMAFTDIFAPSLKAGQVYHATIVFAGHNLAPGGYNASISIGRGDNYEGICTYDGVYPAFSFDVLARRRGDLRESWRDIWGSQHLPAPQVTSFAAQSGQ